MLILAINNSEMRVWVVLVWFLFSGLAASGQANLLTCYALTDGKGIDENIKKIENLINKLDTKAKKSDRQFLKNVFNLTHRQFLKEYDQYAGFGDIFKDGRYDCLTATALYSVLLSELGYQHTIIETNFHIFLLVASAEGKVLMESTDPLGGFEYRQNKIEDRIKAYKADQESASKNGYSYSYNLFEEVSPQELNGLLYYNQCVKAFNQQQWGKAIENLESAKLFYNSPRIVEMENLLVTIIASVELEKVQQATPSGSTQRIAQNNK